MHRWTSVCTPHACRSGRWPPVARCPTIPLASVRRFAALPHRRTSTTRSRCSQRRPCRPSPSARPRLLPGRRVRRGVRCPAQLPSDQRRIIPGDVFEWVRGNVPRTAEAIEGYGRLFTTQHRRVIQQTGSSTTPQAHDRSTAIPVSGVTRPWPRTSPRCRPYGWRLCRTAFTLAWHGRATHSQDAAPKHRSASTERRPPQQTPRRSP